MRRTSLDYSPILLQFRNSSLSHSRLLPWQANP
jgi:hypothetical protein